MDSTVRQTLNGDDLRAAFREKRFELQYQPQVTSRDARLVGVEGLVRLRGASGDLIPPSAFVSTLESMDLIHDVGATLFQHGCIDALRWPGLTVAVNVSPVQFLDPDLASRLISIADQAGVDPQRMDIEITEGTFFQNPERADVALRALSEHGFGIALDDFGTGYSSLGYLLKFPVSKIKLDRSFVIDLPDDRRSATIVHAMVALGRALGLKIVAEGIETEAQQMFLRVAGCHHLQGHLFSQALSVAELTAFYESSLEPRRVA